MSKWVETSDYLDEIWSNNKDALTIDQQLKVAEIMASLSIAQELNRIQAEGISEYVEYRLS